MKKKVIRMIYAFIIITILLWTIWGNVTIGVTRYSVASHSLPAAFDQYTIAVLSDVHNARIGQDNRRLLALLAQQQPDLIAITGDLVDSRRTSIETAEQLVSALVNIAPVYYCTGNHEARLGNLYQELEQKLRRAGVVVLRDRAVTLTKHHETIQIVGLDDPSFTDPDASMQENILQAKLETMNLTDAYCILLSHRPEAFKAYVSAQMDLVLSGHAHGGQFRLPFIGGLVAPNQGLFPKYDAGEFTEKTTTMIVSRGIGNSIIPVRFNNRPEIVIVELRRMK